MIGVGNELRGDDAAGLAVARQLREQTDLDVLELEGEPIGLLDAWHGRDAVVLVDTLAPYSFDRIYGGWWEPVIAADAHRILQRSAARYIEILNGRF